MKTIYLVRHAKSSWKNPELDDFDRPLNKRGKRDAPYMGELLRKKGVAPDLLISSPANRAFTTAKQVAKALEYPLDKLMLDSGIYHASEKDLLRIVKNVPEHLNSVMLFGHNPGFTWFSNVLSGTNLENIPTSGAVQISFEHDSWKKIGAESGTLDWFEYPKKYFT